MIDIGEVELLSVGTDEDRANKRIVQMLKRDGHYRAAKAIKTWTDESGLTYKISSKRIFKTASDDVNLEARISSFLIENYR